MPKYDHRYDLLKEHLRQSAAELSMTFAEIERVIGIRLPRSAKLYRTWWSNNAANHVQAKAWLDAGYRTERVDMAGERLGFVRNAPGGVAEAQREFGGDAVNSNVHPMIGAMKGTFTIEPGWDLTKPALDADELAAWEVNLDRKADLIADGLASRPK